jgi:hypothetical protein
MELASALRSYLREYGSTDHDRQPPDQEILAKCLAIAPLSSLLSKLRELRQHDVRGANNYAWFVTTFAHRLKGIPKNVLAAAQRQHAIERRRRPQQHLDFSTRMKDEIRQKARRIV